MARRPSLFSVREALLNTLDSNQNLFAAVEPLCERTYDGIVTNPLHPAQARRVVALAFLNTISTWEQYVEACFVRYLAGAKSPSGYQPAPKCGYAVSLDHAYQLLTGKPEFKRGSDIVSWSSFTTVMSRADVFFKWGAPFKTRGSPWEQRLKDAFTIRNRIAHTSEKSRDAFKVIALQHLGRSSKSNLSQGFAVGDLLVSSADRGFPTLYQSGTYFNAYHMMFRDILDRLTP